MLPPDGAGKGLPEPPFIVTPETARNLAGKGISMMRT